jgi:hypothetical protein
LGVRSCRDLGMPCCILCLSLSYGSFPVILQSPELVFAQAATIL